MDMPLRKKMRLITRLSRNRIQLRLPKWKLTLKTDSQKNKPSIRSVFQTLFGFLKKCSFQQVKALYLRTKLRTKWMLATLVFIVSFSIIFVSFFLSNGKRNLERELERWGTSLASNLAFNAQYAASVKDYETLQNYLIGIMNEQEILYAVILDESGSILAIKDPDWMFTSNIHDLSSQVTDKDITTLYASDGVGYYHIVKTIEIQKEDLITDEQILFQRIERFVTASGDLKFKLHAPSQMKRLVKVVLGISLENMHARLDNMRDNAISIAILISMICTVVVFWGVNRITAPIKQLVRATQKVAQGNLSHSVESRRKDELGSLADSFNEMIVKLKKSQDKIAEYTQTLEKRVNDRTRELRESEEKYRTLFEHSGTAVALIERDEKLSMINRRFETISGYPKAEIEGQVTFSNFLAPEDQKKIRKYCKTIVESNETTAPINYECTFVDRFGKHKNINLTMSSVPGTKNILASLTDTTKLKDLQKKLIRSQQLAAIGELSASIAHEIRNPLGAINTSVGILKNGLNLNGQDQELMDIICEESMRLKRITDDFLQYARPNKPKFKVTDINGLLQEILILLQHKIGKHIQRSTKLARELPLVLVDPNQLRQVVINIIINAIDAMPEEGCLTISTMHGQNIYGKHHIEVVFKDTGCGISEPELKKIFQPFYSTKAKGAGMGLSICERIIQNHGGEIQVASKLGQGTQFTIILPIKDKNLKE